MTQIRRKKRPKSVDMQIFPGEHPILGDEFVALAERRICDPCSARTQTGKTGIAGTGHDRRYKCIYSMDICYGFREEGFTFLTAIVRLLREVYMYRALFLQMQFILFHTE